MTIREANAADATAMCRILRDILAVWKSDRPSTVAYVSAHYIDHPGRISCFVAVNHEGTLVGFQSLKRVVEGNSYDLPAGWGIIGTYVSAKARGRGVGKALFASSLDVARKAGLTEIDATIGEGNETALAYYDAIGFRTYLAERGAISKKYTVN